MSPISKVTRRYIREFLFRLTVFLLVGGAYFLCPDRLDFTARSLSWPLLLLWGAVLVSMLSQLDANSGLTTGCLKQYPGRFDPVPNYDPQALAQAVRRQDRGAARVAAVWLAVNLSFGLLYHRGLLQASTLVLLCALAYLCDLVCVLFFCPFQFFLMGNRCCVNCRIFAWGSWMMAAPLMCVPHWYSWTLFGTGLLVLCVWEVRFRRYPERFWFGSNRNLQCASCKEQLCRYKWPRRRGG
ncbi:hypothetical protein D1641_15800 [Colidextribacter sp. OB.20]|uniref:hypothetical protein n=1 Tax=Colidextribacter sp. OB.20 TaxID=2304568 RepID=UPI00136EA005|nr:hypothetical protein [Colidextribacter sp. OB.20]NBI11456.1 hypothetical protein [Colidextribacter sp. OB.20]